MPGFLKKLKDEKSGEVLDRFLADFHSLYERRKAPNLGELINIVLDRIEEANKAKLEGVFRNIDFNSEANLGKAKDRNRRLENLLDDFVELDLRPSRVSEDVIGDTYIYLIERFASDAGKKAGSSTRRSRSHAFWRGWLHRSRETASATRRADRPGC